MIAFDFGAKRIGVACGELAVGMAHALTVIHYRNKQHCFDLLAPIVAEWRPVRMVVGLPARDDGLPHELTTRIERFAAELRKRYRVPVEFVDERLSSAAADSDLRGAGMHAGKRAKRLDAEAARLILQTYLGERR